MSLVSPRIKTEPEDDFMSYLNEDCLSMSEPWLATHATSTVHPVKSEPTPAYSISPEFINAFFKALDTIHTMPTANISTVTPPPPLLPYLEPQSYMHQPTPRSSSPAPSSSSDDSEQQQRKRGRKKQGTNDHPHHRYHRADMAPPTIAPAPTSIESTPHTITTSVQERAKQVNANPDVPKETALAKRQERLIKNRAAALLSRKRKREHLCALEEQNQSLLAENESLKSRVSFLEAEIQALKRGNPLPSYSMVETGVVLMLIFLSFAMIAHPLSESSRRPDRNNQFSEWIKANHGKSINCHIYPSRTPSSLSLVTPLLQGYLHLDVQVQKTQITDTAPGTEKEVQSAKPNCSTVLSNHIGKMES